MRLLSIDFDFFFPTKELDKEQWQLYDWGHNEGWPKELSQTLWNLRASAFIRAGLPLPTTSGEEDSFWSRFKFAKNAKLYIADSHVHAAAPEVAKDITSIYNFDAHHDCGYNSHPLAEIHKRGYVTCEDWMVDYWARGVSATVVYPRWKPTALTDEKLLTPGMRRRIDTGEPMKQEFDRIVVAHSGQWTPPWVDDKFKEFLDNCPVQPPVPLEKLEIVRSFDIDQARELAEEMQRSLEKLEA